jgi:hypothetical protein
LSTLFPSLPPSLSADDGVQLHSLPESIQVSAASCTASQFPKSSPCSLTAPLTPAVIDCGLYLQMVACSCTPCRNASRYQQPAAQPSQQHLHGTRRGSCWSLRAGARS